VGTRDGASIVHNPKHRVVLDDLLELLERRVRAHPEVVPGLAGHGVRTGTSTGPEQVRTDDGRSLLRRHFDQCGRVPLLAAHYRSAIGRAQVADPLRLTGEGYEIPLRVVRDLDEGGAMNQTGAATRHF
jgi:hypothetical protein